MVGDSTGVWGNQMTFRVARPWGVRDEDRVHMAIYIMGQCSDNKGAGDKVLENQSC